MRMGATRLWSARSVVGGVIAALAAMGAAQSAPTAITNVRLENGDGSVIEHATILMQDGKFSAVSERVNIPEGATRIDGTGLVAYPGFIDAFSRRMLKLPEIPELPTPPAANEDAPATFWRANRKGNTAAWNGAEIFDFSSLDKRTWMQGITTVNAASGRGVFGGFSSLVNLTPNEQNQVVSKTTAQTIGFASTGGQGYPGSIMGRIAQIRQFLMDAQFEADNPAKEGEGDADVMALSSIYKDKLKVIVLADSEREIHRALDLADENKFRVIIANGKRAWEHADRLKKMNVDILLDVDAGDRPNTNPFGREDPPAVGQNAIEQWEANKDYAVKLEKTGIRFAFVADRAGNDLLKKVRQQISFGLPRSAALKALTVNPAAILGADKTIGWVKQGYTANLVLMSGDFAAEGSTVKHIFVAGEQMNLGEEN